VIHGTDPLILAAFVFLVGAVVGSALPLIPGPLLSLVGVFLYWVGTGYSDPSIVVLAVLAGVALLGVLVELFGGALGAKAGGASTKTTAAAGVVGLLLLFVAGPVGVVLGVAGTVFAIEFVRNRDARASGRAALASTVGVLGSVVVQVLLTLSILLAMVLVAVL